MKSILLNAFFILLATTTLSANEQLYCNDYFVFVGHDAQGKVLFSLDNTRARKTATGKVKTHSESYLYDESKGKIKMEGNGKYKNKAKIIETLPDSEFFTFKGSPETNFTIHSSVNDLQLKLKGLTIVYQTIEDTASIEWRSGEAVLQWKGRMIEGFVLHQSSYFEGITSKELLAQKKKERLQKCLFLNIEDKGFVHLFETNNPVFVPYTNETGGIITIGTMHSGLEKVAIQVNKEGKNPTDWTASFAIESIEYSLLLKRLNLKSKQKSKTRGLKLGLAEGTLEMSGQQFQVFGLVEAW